MKKFFFPLILSLVFVGSVSSNLLGQDILTLEGAIRFGLENNYNILIAGRNKKVFSNNYEYAKYAFLPNLNASATKNHDVEDFEQQFVEGDPRSGSNARSNQLRASVDLEWTIFDGLGMFIAYERLQEISKSSLYNLRDTIESNIADISTKYYQIILEQGRINVLKNTLELSEKRLEIAKSIFEVGRSSKLEYLAAQVDYNTDYSALVAQEELLYNAKIDLNRILGRDVDTDFATNDEITANQDLDKDDLREKLLDNNPNLLSVAATESIASLETRQIRAERYPELSFNAGYGYNRIQAQSGFLLSNISDGYYYGLIASFNIFNGFDISRRVQNAKINEETAEILYDQVSTNLLAGLNNSYVAYQNAIRLVKLESENLKIAQESEEIAYERYKLGVANFLELREAQRNAVEAESRLLNATFNIKVAEIELMRLSGQLFNDNL